MFKIGDVVKCKFTKQIGVIIHINSGIYTVDFQHFKSIRFVEEIKKTMFKFKVGDKVKFDSKTWTIIECLNDGEVNYYKAKYEDFKKYFYENDLFLEEKVTLEFIDV